jgi:phosphohistidine phosphatase
VEVLVLRHGIAEVRPDGDSAQVDRKRALTEHGRKRMKAAARGLARMLPRLDAIATSSLVRAQETAQIVAAEYAGLQPIELADLEPGGARTGVAHWLSGQRADGTVVLVGHSPDLETLVSWLLAGVTTPFLELRKGAACLLRSRAGSGPASAELVWSLPSSALRRAK